MGRDFLSRSRGVHGPADDRGWPSASGEMMGHALNGTHQAPALVHEAPPAMPASFSMVERMMTNPDISIDRVEQAFAFYQKVQGEEARKAFDAAVSSAKAEIPVITKNRKGNNEKRYADFSAFAKVIDPILSKYGLHYRFRTVQTDRISVTCILSHRLGHFEENTLSGPADTTGNKNAIQAIGSTLTYLQRYTLTQSLGLAASEDDDGQSAGGDDISTISEAQQAELSKLISETGTEPKKFLEVARAEGLWDVMAKDFPRLKAMLIKKKATKQ